MQKAISHFPKYLENYVLDISPEKCFAIPYTRRHVSQIPINRVVLGCDIQPVDVLDSSHPTQKQSLVLLLSILIGTALDCSVSPLRLCKVLFCGLLLYTMHALCDLPKNNIRMKAIQAQGVRLCFIKYTATISTLSEATNFAANVIHEPENIRACIRITPSDR